MLTLRPFALFFLPAIPIVWIAAPCYAQLGSARILRPRQTEGDAVRRLTHVTLGTAAYLNQDGRAGTGTSFGAGVAAIDTALRFPGLRGAVQVGGFAFLRNEITYQAQAKYYPHANFGVQVSYLSNENQEGSGNVFGLYNLSSSERDPAAKVPWDVQFGVRVPTGNRNSAFVQLSAGIARHTTLDLSYWGTYPGDERTINRFVVGIGFNL